MAQQKLPLRCIGWTVVGPITLDVEHRLGSWWCMLHVQSFTSAMPAEETTSWWVQCVVS
jgi:hypothetical protein